LARRAARDPFSWIASLWTLGGLVWLWAYRRTGYFELDEAGYVRTAIRLGLQRRWPGFRDVVVHEGNHGPMQSLLALPPQLALRPDPRVVLIENVLLAAGTAVLACWTARRLSTRAAGTVAGTIVLLAPGVIEHSRLALTSTPAMFFGALALYALVRADGLERGRWTAVAGVAVGSMLLSRSMSVGFAPPLALMAIGWAVSRRTPVRTAVRGAVIMATSALITAGWWWYIRWDDVSQYLFGGGSSATERVRDPSGKLVAHASELAVNLGWTVSAVGVGCVVALWPRQASRSRKQIVGDVAYGVLSALAVVVITWRGAVSPDDLLLPARLTPYLIFAGLLLALFRARRAAGGVVAPAALTVGGRPVSAAVGGPGDLAIWPLALAVGVGLAVLSFSTAFGVGFVLPLIPWTVVAGTVTARRLLHDRAWLAWVSVVVVVAVPVAVTMPGVGLDAPLTLCGDDEPRAYCEIHSNEDGANWRIVSDRIADRMLVAVDQGRAAGIEDPRVALTFRDSTVNGNTVLLSMQWRHRRLLDVWSFLQGGAPIDEQIAAVLDGADVVVVVPDRYERQILGAGSPAPEELIAALSSADFVPCDQIPTPGGDDVVVMVSPRMPGSACDPIGDGR